MVKSYYPDGEVLMLTFHDGQEYLRQALRSGASGYITKDIARTELINAVLTVAKGGSLIQASMLRHFIQDLAQDSAAFAFPGSSINKSNTAGTAEILKKLTRREREVLTLIGEGLNNSSISAHLTISQDTVKSHVRSILEKLNVNDRTQAAVLAVRMGLTGK
jgi:DNA-binding NarL/FixJ family response regulator